MFCRTASARPLGQKNHCFFYYNKQYIGELKICIWTVTGKQNSVEPWAFCSLEMNTTKMYCTALPYLTLHYTLLFCPAFHCNGLICTDLHCTSLICTVLHWYALYCTDLHWSALNCTTALYWVLYCCATVDINSQHQQLTSTVDINSQHPQLTPKVDNNMPHQ